MPRKNNQIRLTFGERAPVPHYVRGMKLVPAKNVPNFSYLVPVLGEAVTIFKNLRLAKRAVERTKLVAQMNNLPVPQMSIQQVH